MTDSPFNRYPRNAKRNAAILALSDAGMPQQQIADRFGVTKNTVAGVRNRAGRGVPLDTDPPTLFDRMAELHARMDAVLGVTLGVGRVPNEPRKDARAAIPLGVRYNEVRR